MRIVSVPKWSACITLGMHIGYSEEVLELEQFKSWLQEIQEIQILREKLFLSANVHLSDLVLSGQDEPHVNISFIQYPKLPTSEDRLRAGVMEIAGYLMDKMKQNRLVIALDEEIVMLEKEDVIDHRIINHGK
jgi:hypothetical protein